MLRNLSNPEGTGFEVATFQNLRNIKMHDNPSFESSFFPPYSWQIMSCSKCRAHLGWKFNKGGRGLKGELSVEEEKPKRQEMVCEGEWVREAPSSPREPLEVLEGKCTVSRQGWWTYQWCHRKEIRQYHTNDDGSRQQDWSLGRFSPKPDRATHKLAKRGFPTKHEPHFFTGGQRCDETKGSGRWTEIHFDCCANDDSAIARQAEEENEDTYIRSIEEPGVCHYRMRICAKLLCPKPPKRTCKGKMLPRKEKKRSTNGTLAAARPSIPNFYGLIWPNVVVEDSEELYWVRNLKLRTSLAQVNHMGV
jgi:hypothetical protein